MSKDKLYIAEHSVRISSMPKYLYSAFDISKVGYHECDFCNGVAQWIGEADFTACGYVFMCDGCNSHQPSPGTHETMTEVRTIEQTIGQLESRLNKIYPYSDVLNRYDEVERSQILDSTFYLHQYGCVVWLEKGTLMNCEANSFFTRGYTDAGEVSAPEDQDFLDAVNLVLNTKFQFDQFPGR